MKKLLPSIFVVLSFLLLALPSQAQIVITYEGYSTGGTMPGSASDFFFPNASNYPGQPNFFSNQGGNNAYSQLTSFSIVGGVNGVNGDSSYSSIITPAGGSPILTGDIQASGNPAPAAAFEPGLAGSLTMDGDYNANFDYNDFNVYLMYSNTGGTFQDLSITLAPILLTGPSAGTSATVLLDGLPADAPTDTNVASNTADYLEFNVQGLATAMETQNNLAFVVSTTNELGIPSQSLSNISYIGALSFQEVPEPSTYAMMLGGLVLLGVCVRRRVA
jgi:hypothetical protein